MYDLLGKGEGGLVLVVSPLNIWRAKPSPAGNWHDSGKASNQEIMAAGTRAKAVIF